MTARQEDRGQTKRLEQTGLCGDGRVSEGSVSEVARAFEAKVQVRPGHYGLAYDSASRWVNYGAQVRAVLECNPTTALEVGVGNGTVSAVLRSRGVSVTTLDIDESLNPDIVGSVHELDKYVEPKAFDVVLCAEVLEHLPFELLPRCAQQLATAARRNVIIGLPCFPKPRWGVGLDLHIPKVGLRRVTAFASPLPGWPGANAEHYWEVDYRPYTVAAIRSEIEAALVVDEIRREPLDPSHLLLMCRPTDASSAGHLSPGE